jgi:hypothetical protein
VTAVVLELRGAKQTAAAFRASARMVDAELPKIVKHNGALLRTRVMAKASGRPGPNAVTGDYRRQWQNQFTGGGGSFKSTTGTAAVQARRLEYGFNGMDSLGRVYNQPPYPHARPAFDEVAPMFENDVRALLAEVGD